MNNSDEQNLLSKKTEMTSHKQFNHKSQLLLDWINTLPVSSCLTINKLEDFYDGRVFTDLIVYFTNLIHQEELFSAIIEQIMNSDKDSKIESIVKFLEFFISISGICLDSEEGFVLDLLLKFQTIITNYTKFDKGYFKELEKYFASINNSQFQKEKNNENNNEAKKEAEAEASHQSNQEDFNPKETVNVRSNKHSKIIEIIEDNKSNIQTETNELIEEKSQVISKNNNKFCSFSDPNALATDQQSSFIGTNHTKNSDESALNHRNLLNEQLEQLPEIKDLITSNSNRQNSEVNHESTNHNEQNLHIIKKVKSISKQGDGSIYENQVNKQKQTNGKKSAEEIKNKYKSAFGVVQTQAPISKEVANNDNYANINNNDNDNDNDNDAINMPQRFLSNSLQDNYHQLNILSDGHQLTNNSEIQTPNLKSGSNSLYHNTNEMNNNYSDADNNCCQMHIPQSTFPFPSNQNNEISNPNTNNNNININTQSIYSVSNNKLTSQNSVGNMSKQYPNNKKKSKSRSKSKSKYSVVKNDFKQESLFTNTINKEALGLYILRGVPVKRETYFSKSSKSAYLCFLKPTTPILAVNNITIKQLSKVKFKAIVSSKEKQLFLEAYSKYLDSGDYSSINSSKHHLKSKALSTVSQSTIHNNHSNLNASNYNTDLDYQSTEDANDTVHRYAQVLSKFEVFMNWIRSFNLSKTRIKDLKALLCLCENGVFLADLINKLEGRWSEIPGIIRSSPNQVQVNKNFEKVCEYLFRKDNFPNKALLVGFIGSNKLNVLKLLWAIYFYYYKIPTSSEMLFPEEAEHFYNVLYDYHKYIIDSESKEKNFIRSISNHHNEKGDESASGEFNIKTLGKPNISSSKLSDANLVGRSVWNAKANEKTANLMTTEFNRTMKVNSPERIVDVNKSIKMTTGCHNECFKLNSNDAICSYSINHDHAKGINSALYKLNNNSIHSSSNFNCNNNQSQKCFNNKETIYNILNKTNHFSKSPVNRTLLQAKLKSTNCCNLNSSSGFNFSNSLDNFTQSQGRLNKASVVANSNKNLSSRNDFVVLPSSLELNDAKTPKKHLRNQANRINNNTTHQPPNAHYEVNDILSASHSRLLEDSYYQSYVLKKAKKVPSNNNKHIDYYSQKKDNKSPDSVQDYQKRAESKSTLVFSTHNKPSLNPIGSSALSNKITFVNSPNAAEFERVLTNNNNKSNQQQQSEINNTSVSQHKTQKGSKCSGRSKDRYQEAKQRKQASISKYTHYTEEPYFQDFLIRKEREALQRRYQANKLITTRGNQGQTNNVNASLSFMPYHIKQRNRSIEGSDNNSSDLLKLIGYGTRTGLANNNNTFDNDNDVECFSPNTNTNGFPTFKGDSRQVRLNSTNDTAFNNLGCNSQGTKQSFCFNDRDTDINKITFNNNYSSNQRLIKNPQPKELTSLQPQKDLSYLKIIIREWLVSIGIDIAENIDFNSNVLMEFKDGIMTLVDNRFIHRVKIDPNPIYPSISQLNISKILQYLKLNKKIPIDLLDSEKEFYLGDPFIILNILNQIRLAFKNEVTYNKSLKKKLMDSRSGLNFSCSNSVHLRSLSGNSNKNNCKSAFNNEIEFNNSLNNTKYNDLKNLEKRESRERKVNCESGLVFPKTCKVNGVDHSQGPFAPLNNKQRGVFLMKKENFFN